MKETQLNQLSAIYKKKLYDFQKLFCVQFIIDTFKHKEKGVEIDTETNKLFLFRQKQSVAFSKILNTWILDA